MFELIIPGFIVAVLNIIILYKFFHHKLVWWEPLPPLFLSILIGFLIKAGAESAMTSDVEYHGGWATTSFHQEPWTEEYEVDDYCTDKDGKSYRCGSHTEYRDHPEKWWLENSNGETIDTDSSDYLRLKNLWGNETRENGHHDDFDRVTWGYNYTGEGYCYHTTWTGSVSTLVPTTTRHRYENRIQAVDNTLFHFAKLHENDIKDYGLYELPEINGFYGMQYVHGNSPGVDEANRKLEHWNAVIGRSKQVQMRILIFVNQPIEAGLAQEAYWQGGNKNEFTVCVGVNSENETLWAHVISWTNEEHLKIQVRDVARSMKKFDPVALADKMVPMIQESFIRKQFKEFDYLEIKIPVWGHILSLILCIVMIAGVDYIIINNENTMQSAAYNKYNRMHRFKT